ncbi:hypothetical protein RUM44_002414 [Polyplax serrata]|uniref:Uncharacterized protein n=1 Tax=Polyplax serrata TaxID=468196 RepID=A0ABR1AEQ1_POLSC
MNAKTIHINNVHVRTWSTSGSGGVSRGRKTALGEELDAGGTSCLNYFKVALGSVVHSKHTQVFIKQKKKKKKKPRRQGKKKRESCRGHEHVLVQQLWSEFLVAA